MYTNKIETFHPAHGRGHEPSRTLLIFCLLISGFFHFTAASNTASAATYYLDAVNGDDSYDGLDPVWDSGTHGPWKSIVKAKSSVSAGDTVFLMSGNYGSFSYRGNNDFPHYTGDMDEPLPESTEYVSWKAYPGETPVFSGIRLGNSGAYNFLVRYIFDGFTISTTSGVDGINLYHCVGVRLKNLTVTGSTPMLNNVYGIFLRAAAGRKCNDIEIENCSISLYEKGIKTYASNVVVRDCNVYNIRQHVISPDSRSGTRNYNLLFEDNHLHHTIEQPRDHPDGFIFSGSCTNVTVRNNIVHDIGGNPPGYAGGQGIYFYALGGYSNVLVENNLVYDVWATEIKFNNINGCVFRNNTVIGHYWNQPNIGSAVFHDGITGLEVYNNIFVSAYDIKNLAGTIYHNYNIHINSGGGRPWETEPNSYGYSDWQTALEELFIDGYNYNFRLKEGCRAVDFGDPNYVPEEPNDLDGNPRVSNGRIDAGCYEYMSQSLVPDAGPDQTVTDSDDNGSEQYTPTHCRDKNSGFLRWIHRRMLKQVGTEGARRATGVPTATPYTSAGVR